jgi:UDP-N-acetylmuramate dehydrogenase
VEVTAAAGESWDDLVRLAVGSGLAGLEALVGIPGTAGAAPLQNIGAYGQEVADTIVCVDVYDRSTRQLHTFDAADCRFSYRSSRFKCAPNRYVSLSVRFRLRRERLSAPVRYAQLADSLGISVGGRAPIEALKEAVLQLRRSKGMVLDEADHDTWSAGSFFTNPIVEPERLPRGAPAFPQPDGRVKTSAAWLIEHAGFTRGYGDDRASLSSKHTLAVTNRGTANTRDVLELAATLRLGVRAQFGILLEPEPVLVGCALS